MALRWTVVIEIDPDLASAARTGVLRPISQFAEALGLDIRESSTRTLVAFTSDRDTADRLADAARGTHAVTAAYVKPPDAMP